MSNVPKMVRFFKLVTFLMVMIVFWKCGAVPKKKPTIMGGLRPSVNPHRFDFMVMSLIFRGENSSICSGSLVHEQWMLTAAHCLLGVEVPAMVLVIAGRKDLAEYMYNRLKDPPELDYDESYFGIQERRAASLHPHEKFDRKTLENDIALVWLKEPFHLNENVSTVEISTRKFTSKDVCTLLGWGEQTPSKLDFNLYYLDKQAALPHDSCGLPDLPNFVCLEDTSPDRGIAMGDSGGPLLCGTSVRGVASYVTELSDRQVQNVYVTTEPYIDWMKGILKTDQNNQFVWLMIALAGIVVIMINFIIYIFHGYECLTNYFRCRHPGEPRQQYKPVAGDQSSVNPGYLPP